MVASRQPRNAQAISTITRKYTDVFGVPHSLVMAIIGLESGYNPGAHNDSERAQDLGGAWGLGQMTLSTATDITTRYPSIAAKYWPRWNRTGIGLLDPEINAAMTSFLLSLAWKKYATVPNRWLTTGVAHHQGMGTIDKLIKQYGKITPDILPPFGKQYYAMIEKQRDTNQLVSSLYTSEIGSGAKYA